jgi:ribonuclease T
VDDPGRAFYVEPKPVSEAAAPGAMAVHNVDLDKLKRDGLPPAETMRRFEAWLQSEIPTTAQPVFVGFNAAFDWMFVADCFDRFLGRNPFSHTALDIKAYFMGLVGGAWHDTTKSSMARRYPDRPHLTHNALQDALDQAAVFRRIRDERPTPDRHPPLTDSAGRNLIGMSATQPVRRRGAARNTKQSGEWAGRVGNPSRDHPTLTPNRLFPLPAVKASRPRLPHRLSRQRRQINIHHPARQQRLGPLGRAGLDLGHDGDLARRRRLKRDRQEACVGECHQRGLHAMDMHNIKDVRPSC